MGDRDREKDEGLFDETLDAAKIFDDLAKEIGPLPGSPASPDTFTDEYSTPEEAENELLRATAIKGRAPTRTEEAEPVATGGRGATLGLGPAPTQGSIGELFLSVVRRSPLTKMRVEEASIGALFRRFIR